MAYEPKTWVCGETITADGLNNIEEGVQEALECCGSGGDCGYSCTESQETVFEGSLTTASMGQMYGVTFTPTEPIEGDSITVSFNGTEYELPKVTVPFGDGYGDFDASSNPVFTNYPCAIGISNGQHYFFTQSGGTYQVAIYGMVLTAETTECFEKAVIKVIGEPLKYVKDSPTNVGGVVENEVNLNKASGDYSHAGGVFTVASGASSHAEGNHTIASGASSHAEGFYAEATNAYSHAEGYSAEASGEASHAEGSRTKASSDYSHAEGERTTASGRASHAEGENTTASGRDSHAEGSVTTASGYDSHAEGNGTTASATSSHAEGESTTASGRYSHAQNEETIAQGMSQTAIGKFNVAQGAVNAINATDYAFIIGNGTTNNRSNALAIKWDGTFVFANGTEITPAQFASLLALL